MKKQNMVCEEERPDYGPNSAGYAQRDERGVVKGFNHHNEPGKHLVSKGPGRVEYARAHMMPPDDDGPRGRDLGEAATRAMQPEDLRERKGAVKLPENIRVAREMAGVINDGWTHVEAIEMIEEIVRTTEQNYLNTEDQYMKEMEMFSNKLDTLRVCTKRLRTLLNQ